MILEPLHSIPSVTLRFEKFRKQPVLTISSFCNLVIAGRSAQQ